MKRQKAPATSTPAYPTRSRFQPPRAVLACAGLLLVTIMAPGCPGDISVPIDGDVAVPSETFFVSLPAEGSGTAFIESDEAVVDFHVELVVDNRELSRFLRDNADELLGRLELLLGNAPSQSLRELEDIHEVERRIRQLLADQWAGGSEAPVWNFVECTLVIDEIVHEEPVDGDMPA